MLREALTGFFECCAETGTFQDAIEEPGVISAFPVAGAVAGGISPTLNVPEWERLPINTLPPRPSSAAASQAAVH